VKLCCNSEEDVEEREDNADAIDGFANKHNVLCFLSLSGVTGRKLINENFLDFRMINK